MDKNNSFYSHDELRNLGLKSFGKNVSISKKASIYNSENIVIGNNVRIDDFCILSGNINIGSYVHIAAYVALYGKMGISLKDFTGLSPHTVVFSASDDFSGDYLAGPTIPEKYTNVWGGEVTINKYALVGAGSIILPKVIIGKGAAIAAMSLVNRNIGEWKIYGGVPAKFMKNRSKGVVEKERALLRELKIL